MATLTNLFFHSAQKLIFFESKARYKIIAKGRRFGLTFGFALYVILYMLREKMPVLWVDTSYPNVLRYFDRYFFPILKKLPARTWKFNRQTYELKLNGTWCDFRSATHPDNIEGFGYGLVVINEAGIVLRNPRIWHESVRPMMMEHKAAALIGGTPKGKRLKKLGIDHPFFELYERAKKKSAEGNTDWQDFQFSSYDNKYLDPEEIAEMWADMPPGLRDQEIYGKFIDLDGEEILKREWWQWYDAPTRGTTFIFQSWDTAFKTKETNDWSVCTTWQIVGQRLECLDMWRGRVPFPSLVKVARNLVSQWKPNRVIIEDRSSGTSLIQVFREEGVSVDAIEPIGDKVLRGHRVTPYLERGQVWLPAGIDGAPPPTWTGELVDECADVPMSEHDDIYDTVTQAIEYARPHLDRPAERVRPTPKTKRMRGSETTKGY